MSRPKMLDGQKQKSRSKERLFMSLKNYFLAASTAALAASAASLVAVAASLTAPAASLAASAAAAGAAAAAVAAAAAASAAGLTSSFLPQAATAIANIAARSKDFFICSSFEFKEIKKTSITGNWCWTFSNPHLL
jgi:hypothetical protein